MVTNVPFYSFKDVASKKSVPFAVIVSDRLGDRGSSTSTPRSVVFGIFVLYGLSGYVVYAWRHMRWSTDQRDQYLNATSPMSAACTTEPRKAWPSPASGHCPLLVVHFGH